MWPEPDLPRTSTGKVKRKPVAAWLARIQAAAAAPSNGKLHPVSNGTFGPSSDWLLALIAQITGESNTSVGDELRLTEDLHLDSLGRVQLAAAIEERLGIVQSNGLLEEVQTLGDLRKIVAGDIPADGDALSVAPSPESAQPATAPAPASATAAPVAAPPPVTPPRPHFLYPTWPWWAPFQWIRIAFIEVIARPLTWLLAAPRVVGPLAALPPGPLLIIGNHVTAYDAALIEYALPGQVAPPHCRGHDGRDA